MVTKEDKEEQPVAQRAPSPVSAPPPASPQPKEDPVPDDSFEFDAQLQGNLLLIF